MRSTGIVVARVAITRLLGLVLTMLVASLVIFSALYLAPGSPITFLTQGRSVSSEALAQIKAQYHLDQSFFAQYWYWLTDALHLDFGNSIIYNSPVSSLLGARAENSLFLVLYAATLILVVGLIIGIVAGLRPGILDSSLMLGSTAAMAVPSFVAAVVLTLVFSVNLGWFPVFGPGTGFIGRLSHLTLPAISLALTSVAFVARLTRTAVRRELRSEHVQTAISRGMPFPTVIRRHVLRNAAVPIVTVAGLTVASLIAGSVVVEQLFQLNGLGSYLVVSVTQKDFAVVQAICLIYVATFIVMNTLIDLSYSLLDPRISLGGQPA